MSGRVDVFSVEQNVARTRYTHGSVERVFLQVQLGNTNYSYSIDMNNWFAAGAAGVLAIVGGFGGHNASSTRDMHMNIGSTTRHEQRDEKPFGRTASSTKSVDIACVSAAAATRESALGAAIVTFNNSISAAYTARASALASAYASTDQTTVKNSVKTAWTNFKGATTAAKKGWQSSKEGAWKTYKTAIKSCGAGAQAVADTSNAGSDVSGQ